MINSLNTETVNNIISNLSEAIETLKTEIANVDEKYRKLLEEAKASLTEALSTAQAQYDYWCNLASDEPATEKKTRKPRMKKINEASTEDSNTEEVTIEATEPEEKEEVVVDTLFEDNNEAEESVEEVIEEDLPESEPSEEEVPATSDPDEWPEMPEEWK